MARVKILKAFGAPQAPPARGAKVARNNSFFIAAERHPKFFLFSFTAAHGCGFPNGHPWRPKGGAEGAAHTEGEGNPAEGVCLASLTYSSYIIYIYIHIHTW